MSNKFEYDAIIHETQNNGGAYVTFPWDIRELFGKGRIKVHAEFDGIPYDGSIVNMGVKDSQGNVCYVIGVLKSIREKLKKGDGLAMILTLPLLPCAENYENCNLSTS